MSIADAFDPKGVSVSKLDPHLHPIFYLRQPLARIRGFLDRSSGSRNAYMQQEFDRNTLQPMQGLSALILTDTSTACHQTTPPLTVDIVDGELCGHDEAASARAVLSSTQMFRYDKLANDLLGLYRSISHDPSASQSLYKLISEILDTSTEVIPGNSRVDVLVIPYEGRFHCPFAGCQKKDTGWDVFRDAREHIWIHHLWGRLLCPWNGCGETFSRDYDRNRHIKVHMGLGEQFVCTTCGRIFTRNSNLKRHIKKHDFRVRRSVID